MVRRGLGRQAARSRAQRMRLGADVFRAVTPVPERVLLVDDVLTTGTTLRRAVRTLLTAGAAEVFCGVVARTPDSRRPT
jgi:predicted amidophosphoribosyltransferase